MSDDEEYELRVEDTYVEQEPVDAAAMAAAPYLKMAKQKAAAPVSKPELPKWPLVLGIYPFPFYLSSLGAWTYMTLGLTFAGLLVTVCYHIATIMLQMVFYVALPGGVVVTGLVSYSSAAYLCVIQETANGARTVEGWPTSGWREWFWTMPSTLGMLAAAGLLGFSVCRISGINSAHLPTSINGLIQSRPFPAPWNEM